jgi:hypothetical protein
MTLSTNTILVWTGNMQVYFGGILNQKIIIVIDWEHSSSVKWNWVNIRTLAPKLAQSWECDLKWSGTFVISLWWCSMLQQSSRPCTQQITFALGWLFYETNKVFQSSLFQNKSFWCLWKQVTSNIALNGYDGWIQILIILNDW